MPNQKAKIYLGTGPAKHELTQEICQLVIGGTLISSFHYLKRDRFQDKSQLGRIGEDFAKQMFEKGIDNYDFRNGQVYNSETGKTERVNPLDKNKRGLLQEIMQATLKKIQNQTQNSILEQT